MCCKHLPNSGDVNTNADWSKGVTFEASFFFCLYSGTVKKRAKKKEKKREKVDGHIFKKSGVRRWAFDSSMPNHDSLCYFQTVALLILIWH